jgi:hypothetical protein
MLDMNKLALFIHDLKRSVEPCRVGLSASFAPAHFSNFSFVQMNSPLLKSKARVSKPAPAGTITSWEVSAPFDGKTLERKYEITSPDKQKLNWRTLASESSGITNLARLQGINEGVNTVFARVTIQSDREQFKKLKFGFSDEVKVYFNDRLIYGGSDTYQSRDYRFLGTMDFFDEVYLLLKMGINELWFAVSEDFGGWGILAALDNLDGVTINKEDAIDQADSPP